MIEGIIIKIEPQKENVSNYNILSSNLISTPFFEIQQIGLDSKECTIEDANELSVLLKENSILNLYAKKNLRIM